MWGVELLRGGLVVSDTKRYLCEPVFWFNSETIVNTLYNIKALLLSIVLILFNTIYKYIFACAKYNANSTPKCANM